MATRTRPHAVAACLLATILFTSYSLPSALASPVAPGGGQSEARPAPAGPLPARHPRTVRLLPGPPGGPERPAGVDPVVSRGAQSVDGRGFDAGTAVSERAGVGFAGSVEPAHRLALLEAQALRSEAQAARPVTAAVLVVPVQFEGSDTLDYLVHNADGSQCITTTGTFTGPRHGAIPYPGGTVTNTIDNNTVYYPSTEPEDYARLIFGHGGYQDPVRAGDPNVNDGAGVDIRGLTVQNYFAAQSDNTVTITGTVASWVGVDHSEAFYGIDYCLPGVSPLAIPDEQIGQLADLAIDSAEAVKARGGEYATYAFWKRLDHDGDGFVDSLWLVHAGRGQEYGGGSEGAQSIWSREASVIGQERPGGYVIHDNGTPDPSDDVRLGGFTVLPEDSDLGVLVEEFGHQYFDLPDLYTNDADNSVGWWAPMSAGIWGGELGGTRPVNMPLWFRMVADCGGAPCGWADPVKVVSATTQGETVVLGEAGEPAGGTVAEGAHAGETIYEGARISLPDLQEVVPNRAGRGGGAYSGNATGSDLTLARRVTVSGPMTLTVAANWAIPRYWGYAYVEASRDGTHFETLPDLDGYFSDANPFGLNEGWGLTGSGAGTLRFDLSAYAGGSVTLRFRYFTYQGGVGTGWWIDDVALLGASGAPQMIDDFEGGLGGWSAAGWQAVPLTRLHEQYYLLEWRNDNGWDQSLRMASSTSYHDLDEWRVDHVPANVPAAVLMYRNTAVPFTGSLLPQEDQPPSWGAKYALLVVDPNFWPTLRGSGASYSGDLESLDAGLARQAQPAYSLEVRDPHTGALVTTDEMNGRASHSNFNDALGVFPGLRVAPDGSLSPWDEDASVVLPARGGRTYSTRVTNADMTPALQRYGEAYDDAQMLGSGDPGDANAAFGVHVDVVDQAPDGRWGAVHIYNSGGDYTLDADATTVAARTRLTLTLRATSIASEGTPSWHLTVPYGVVIVDGGDSGTLAVPAGGTATQDVVVQVGDLAPGQRLTFSATFDDGWHAWQREHSVTVAGPVYLPLLAPVAPMPTP